MKSYSGRLHILSAHPICIDASVCLVTLPSCTEPEMKKLNVSCMNSLIVYMYVCMHATYKDTTDAYC